MDDGTLSGEQRFLIHDLSWDAYETLLKNQDRHRTRMTYDRGHLELMRPLSSHEWTKKLLGRFIEELTLEMNIPIRSAGSTTLRNESLAIGLEPDESYYIHSEWLVRGLRSLDLASSPVPDLAVEIEIVPNALSRMAIYAALGVAEVWLYDGNALRFFETDNAGDYRVIDQSVNLPVIDVEIPNEFLARRHATDENSLVREFRQWVHDNLISGR